MTTLDLQRSLLALGHHPGPLDGVRGRLTIRAIQAFQVAHGLAADGIVGPETSAALRADPGAGLGPEYPKPVEALGERLAAVEQVVPWYAEALRLKGTREAAGAADNPLLLRWAQALGLGYAHDSVAWCGLFVAHCIAASLPDEALPTNPLGARNWLRFGVQTEPQRGAVLVFWRGSPGGWQGHVGFYAGEDAAAFHVLGGNQADEVSVARIARTRCIGARWPSTAPLPSATRRTLAEGAEASGALSTNEA